MTQLHRVFRKRPYEALYNHLVLRAKLKNQEIALSYEDFLEFTKIPNCHYCTAELFWNKCNLNKQKATGYRRSVSTNLDRKDNALGYTKENCVTCCKRCNRAKSSHFTYDEWYGMTEFFRRSNA